MRKVTLYVFESGDVIVMSTDGFVRQDLVEDTTIKNLLTLYLMYDVVDIQYPNQDVKQAALIKPILLKNIQDKIRKDNS